MMNFTILKEQDSNSLETVLQQLHIPKKEMHWLRMSKKVTVNNKLQSIREKVYEKDKIYIPDFDTSSNYTRSNNKATIVYQDEYLAILKKPHNQKTHPNQDETNTLMNDAAYTLNSDYIEPIHRLDFETSGLLLVALNAYVKKILDYMISNNDIVREYKAIVSHKGNLKIGKIDAPIARAKHKNRFEISQKFGKQSVTHILNITDHNNITLSLETGRSHQIRVHLAHLKAPIVGDTIYGSKESKYLQLNANRISFVHPITKKTLNIIDKE